MLKVLVLFTPYGLHCASQKERNILLCSKVLYLYLTIFYIVSSTIVLYANITVFILYFIPFTILDMYCKNTNTLIFPRCSYFHYCCCYYRYFIIIMSSGFRGVSWPTKDLRTANILCTRSVSAGEPGLDAIANEY